MSRSLTMLKGAVRDALGDVSELISDLVIERALNEGQRRMEPEVLQELSTAINWADADAGVSVPADVLVLVGWQPDVDSRYTNRATGRLHGGTLYFDDPITVRAWGGTLFYRGRYPAITPDQPCLLPEIACDGLVDYALHKCFKRIASNRSDYRKFSTLTNNATTVADLLDIAQGYFTDWQDAKIAAADVHQPEPFYR